MRMPVVQGIKCMFLILIALTFTPLRAPAETVYYTLENVMMNGGEQMTGVFSFTYESGDFENGEGERDDRSHG